MRIEVVCVAATDVAQPVDSAGRFANLDCDEVEAAKLDAEEAFEVDLQVDEVLET